MSEEEKLLLQLESIRAKKNLVIKKANIYFTAPFMLYLAFKKKPLNKIDKRILTILGIGTITVNWLAYKEAIKKIQ